MSMLCMCITMHYVLLRLVWQTLSSEATSIRSSTLTLFNLNKPEPQFSCLGTPMFHLRFLIKCLKVFYIDLPLQPSRHFARAEPSMLQIKSVKYWYDSLVKKAHHESMCICQTYPTTASWITPVKTIFTLQLFLSYIYIFIKKTLSVICYL